MSQNESDAQSPDGMSDEEVAKALEGYEADFKDLDPFTTELGGILGDKAKAAVIVTPLGTPDLLAAFCVLADISAWCVGSPKGAVAILKNLEGSSPESAAKDITVVVSGLSVVLAVNRADKMEAHLWFNGEEGDEFSPPILFMSIADFVEDYMIGATDIDGLRTAGIDLVDSGSMSRGEALKIISQHTNFNAGPDGQASVE